jgi:hypothetical protein
MYSITQEDAVMLQHSAELEMSHRFKLQHESRMQELEFAERKRSVDRGNDLAPFILLGTSIVFLYYL